MKKRRKGKPTKDDSAAYHTELEKAIGSCRSLLDIGCGSASPIRNFPGRFHSVGIDAFGQSIKKSMEQKIHSEYCEMDALDIDKRFKPGSFDCVLALDMLEHLTKPDGLKLINMMERTASAKVIIFTPNGFFDQGEYDDNPWQLHKSGWTAGEMRRMGYKVIGINGWKPLRGEQAKVKFRPKKLWKWIAGMTQVFVKNHPEKAFQILCVKEKAPPPL